MKAQIKVPFVGTTIIPDRNAGIGSLLRDLQDSRDPVRDGPPLLGAEFAFIDVGASRASVSTTLQTLLVEDLRMNVDYVATELPEVVPYAYLTLPGSRAEKIRSYLSGMITTNKTTRKVMDWHYVVDQKGRISSVAYSYNHYGNEVWEAYYMGRSFMISGEKVEFRDPALDEILVPDVHKIETMIDLERQRNCDPGQPVPSWHGYRIKKNPLEEDLAESGITLQKTNVPQRVNERQNVLFLGNVLNHYPKYEQASELDRITENMQDGDIVIVQVDEEETSFIEVFLIKGHGGRKTHERIRWIDANKLEVRKPVPGMGAWQTIHLKPGLGQIVSHLNECLGRKFISPKWSQENYKVLVRQNINQVFGTFFRAMPVEETLRIAIREALRRLPSEVGPKGIPVFRDDSKDAYGGELGSDLSPIVSEADLNNMKMAHTNVTG